MAGGMDVTVGFMMTDGGSNMKAATETLGLKCIYCVAHVLQLVVKNTLSQGSSENPQDVLWDPWVQAYILAHSISCKIIISVFILVYGNKEFNIRF